MYYYISMRVHWCVLLYINNNESTLVCGASTSLLYWQTLPMAKLPIYTGKGLGPTLGTATSTDVGLCTRVLLELMKGKDFSGHQLYTDNYYTSPILYLTLHNYGVDACVSHFERHQLAKQMTVCTSVV